jgi:hypothetical protein
MSHPSHSHDDDDDDNNNRFKNKPRKILKCKDLSIEIQRMWNVKIG